MKKMNLKNFMNAGLSVILGITMLCSVSSCGKKSETNPSSGKTAKFTITVNGATASDNANLNLNGFAVNGSTSIWNLNGIVQNNQAILLLPTTDFTGNTKTYVVESTTPLTGPIIAQVDCSSAGDNMTISFESEINGIIKENDQNVVVTPNAPYSHNFTY